MSSVLDRRPGYLPQGFTLRYTLAEGREPGFGWVEEQTVLVYTRGWSPEDFTFPLVVCVGRLDAPDLVGTGPEHGTTLPVSLAGVEVVYHDGITVAELEGGDFAGTSWQQGWVHSVTARSASGTFAVRGPRGLAVDELVATLVSLSPES